MNKTAKAIAEVTADVLTGGLYSLVKGVVVGYRIANDATDSIRGWFAKKPDGKIKTDEIKTDKKTSK